ncbi:MAG: biotin/lipoyl-binding protein, partial [Nodosilinea sp.]
MVRINGLTPNQTPTGDPDGDAVLANQPSRQQTQFDKPVILRQSPRWSRAVVWTLVGVTTFSLAWACLAKFEEAIPAQGKLEPKGMVQPVQAPVGGVVEEVLVEEGQTVEVGEPLLRFDPETTQAQLESLEAIRTKLLEENAYYKAQLADEIEVSAPVDIAPGLVQLTSNRAALVAENALYRAQLAGDATGETLPAAQRDRLRASNAELNSRLSIADLEVDQLRRQLTQTQAQLANARDALRVNQNILD